MRLSLAAVLLLCSTIPLVLAIPASAEDCRETFVRLLTGQSDKGPVKIHVTQEIAGGPTTKNYTFQAEPGHWMTQMVEPAGMMWTLVYKDVMYSSTDKGESWQKVRTLDSTERQDQGADGLKEAAETTSNAECREEELDGVTHQVVEADYDYPKLATSHHQVYWVNPKTGWISKSVTKTKQAGFESVATQRIEPAPDLKLPTPE